MSKEDNSTTVYDCAHCSLGELCLPAGLSSEELEALDGIINKRRVIEKGAFIFREGDEFSGLYAVRSGSFKATVDSQYSHEHVAGFYLPGEIMGLEAIHSDNYMASISALETSSICELPFQELLSFASNAPNLQKQLLRLMSQRMAPSFAVNASHSAEAKLASFLLSLSARFQKRALSPTEFSLSMSRQDIGSYLGVAHETVSRLFTHFQDIEILSINRREVQLHDLRQLQLIACDKHS